jgi:hypothetical protein
MSSPFQEEEPKHLGSRCEWDLLRLDCVLCYVPGPVLYVWKESGAQDAVFNFLIPRPSRTGNRIAAAALIRFSLGYDGPHLCSSNGGFMDTNRIIADINTEIAILDMTTLELTDEQYDKLRRA